MANAVQFINMFVLPEVKVRQVGELIIAHQFVEGIYII